MDDIRHLGKLHNLLAILAAWTVLSQYKYALDVAKETDLIDESQRSFQSDQVPIFEILRLLYSDYATGWESNLLNFYVNQNCLHRHILKPVYPRAISLKFLTYVKEALG